MTTAEIMGKIYYNEGLIEQHNEKISELRERISVLSEMCGKFSNLQTDFDARIGARKNKLGATVSVENSIFAKFYEGMNELLTGSEYEAARNSPAEAKTKINTKISEYEGEISTRQGNITYLQGRNEYWRTQLQYAEDAQ